MKSSICAKGKALGLSVFFLLISFYAYTQSCDCPPATTCGTCVGGLTSLTLRFNGSSPRTISATDHLSIRFIGIVRPGDTFTFTGSIANGKFIGDVDLFVTAIYNTSISTSCGSPAFVGSTFGSFTVVGGESLNGGLICCLPSDIETELPVISGCADIYKTTSATSCNQTVNWKPPTATDNCSVISFDPNYSPGSTFPIGTTVVTYTARDAANNTSTCSFNVVVTDVTKPVIAGCPSTINVTENSACSGVANWKPPTATDNCSVISFDPNYSPGSTFPIGTTIVTYTARDAANNISTCSFNVVIPDVTKPVIAGCPSTINVTENSACGGVANWKPPTATDNCSVISFDPNYSPGSTFPIGTTIVTYTARDAANNISTCSFNVVIPDVTKPVIAGCSPTINVTENSACGGVANWKPPTATDNCSVISFDPNYRPGSTFPIGTTIVTYTAKDAVNNTSTCSFNVVVTDATPPVITGCPSTINGSANAFCKAVVNWTTPSATDNCGIDSIASSHKSGDTFPIGATEVSYQAKDVYGNISYCKFNVVVKNIEGPVFSNCSNDINVKAGESGEVVVDWEKPIATVQCGDVSYTSTHEPGSKFSIGTTKVKYEAFDESGDRTVCSFNVNVSYEEVVLDISKVITPDGDGINDAWILAGIEKFKNNEVTIVDRWGGLIYHASGYNNEGIVWDGVNRNGAIVPTGTYFYTIEVQFRDTRVEKRGFIELIR